MKEKAMMRMTLSPCNNPRVNAVDTAADRGFKPQCEKRGTVHDVLADQHRGSHSAVGASRTVLRP